MHVTKAAPNMVPALLHSCPKTLRNPSVPLRTRLQLKLFLTVLKLQTVSLLAPSMPFLSLYLCRYVDQVLPLGRYDWLESYCRLLQHDAAEGALRADTFLGCAELLQIGGAGSSWGRRFAVVTGHSLVGFETKSAAEAQEAGVGASCFVCHDRCVLLASADSGCSHSHNYGTFLILAGRFAVAAGLRFVGHPAWEDVADHPRAFSRPAVPPPLSEQCQ